MIYTSNPFTTVYYDTSDMFGVPVVKMNAEGNDIDEQLFTTERLSTMPEPGLFPAIKNLACDKIDQAISDAETLAQTWKPTPELLKQYDEWLAAAKEKQKNCATDVHPIPKKKLSKNLTPVVVGLGVVVIAVVAYKVFKK